MKKLLIGTLAIPVCLLAWGYGTAKVGNIKYPECGEYWKTLSLYEKFLMSICAIPPVTKQLHDMWERGVAEGIIKEPVETE